MGNNYEDHTKHLDILATDQISSTVTDNKATIDSLEKTLA